jgi:hypothetical protein
VLDPGLGVPTRDAQLLPQVVHGIAIGGLALGNPEDLFPTRMFLEEPVRVTGQGGPRRIDDPAQFFHRGVQFRKRSPGRRGLYGCLRQGLLEADVLHDIRVQSPLIGRM